jgi:Tol biopolymer transport system component
MTRLAFAAACGFAFFCSAAATRAEQPVTTETCLSDVVQLTSGFERAGEAYFSPDMKWVIFQATTAGQQHYAMYVARVRREGDVIRGIEQPIRVSPDNSRNTCGHFAPDGRTLIFGSTAGKEDPQEPSAGYQREGRDYRWAYPRGMEIYRADNWLDDVEKVGPGGAIDLTRTRLTENDAYDAECSYSPDGKWIVFTSNRESPPRPAPPAPTTQPDPAAVNKDLELYLMRADGTGVVRLTNAPGYDGGPFFSPDGKRIVYRSDRRNNNLLQVFVADLVFDGEGNVTGTANEKQLTDDANVNWGPYWHPDGRHVIYATSAHGHTNYELYMMRADGSGKTRVTHAAGADVLPVFSPDGKYLLWASKRNGQSTQIYAARFTMPE